jgi:hypothetical protein
MHEVSQRWTLTMAVIAAIVGIVALVLGAFVAPIPTHTDATQVATALFIRGFLALVALAAAFGLAYYAGYRIEAQLGPSNAEPSPAMASSPLIAMFTTPGPRRDAIFSGALVLIAYWFFTTIYIAALGRTVGDVGVTASTLGSFAVSRLLLGLALTAAGAGAGGLGARNAATRRITQRIFSGPALIETAQPAAQPAAQPIAQPVVRPTAPDVVPPSDTPPRAEGE